MNKFTIIGGIVGLLVVAISAILGFWVLPDYIERKIEEEVSLTPLSDTWNKWVNIDKPLFLSVYVFNVTNPDTYNVDGYPILQEVGPFAYRQRRIKVNLSLAEPSLVSYEQQTYYTFDKNASGPGLTEDMTFNILNIPFYLLVEGTASLGLAPVMGNLILRNEAIIRRGVSVEELMFKGMNVSNITSAILGSGFPIPIPDAFLGDLFGLYRGQNGSSDGVYRIHTGVGDIENFGQILSFNGKPDLGYWQPISQCDRVVGSDGTIFPPFVKKDRIVNIFSSDICRSLYFKYESEQSIRGIKGLRFTVPKEVLENPRTNQDNRCYCNQVNTTDCLGAGVIDVKNCKGAPFIMSMPYFLNGEQVYSQDSGLFPVTSKHETVLVIEPNSGALLKANKRIQLNVDYKHFENVFAQNGTESMIFPVLWIDENTEFTEENAEELKDKLLNPKKAVETWRWVGVGIGIGIVLLGSAIYVWKG